MRLEVARDRSAAVVLDVAGQQVRRRGRRVSSDDDGDHFSAANRRSAHQRAGAGQVLAERLTVRLIRFYTLPTWDQRIQYQTCYNLPLSRAKLWVVSQLWSCAARACRTLHPSLDPEALLMPLSVCRPSARGISPSAPSQYVATCKQYFVAVEVSKTTWKAAGEKVPFVRRYEVRHGAALPSI